MTLPQLLIGKTPQERIRICYRVLERLRLRHNEVGAQFRNAEITEQQWKDFLSLWEARFQRVSHILNTIRENQNLFAEANLASNRTLKEAGKILTTYDADIDIETV